MVFASSVEAQLKCRTPPDQEFDYEAWILSWVLLCSIVCPLVIRLSSDQCQASGRSVNAVTRQFLAELRRQLLMTDVPDVTWLAI